MPEMKLYDVPQGNGVVSVQQMLPETAKRLGLTEHKIAAAAKPTPKTRKTAPKPETEDDLLGDEK